MAILASHTQGNLHMAMCVFQCCPLILDSHPSIKYHGIYIYISESVTSSLGDHAFITTVFQTTAGAVHSSD